MLISLLVSGRRILDIATIFDIAAEASFFTSRHALFDWLNANPALGMHWVAFLHNLAAKFTSWFVVYR